jgi:hypothetical protein
MNRFSLLRAGLFLVATGFALPALAEQFEFAPPSHVKLNRIYKIDKLTGEITACQYGAAEGTVGVTICYPAGEGATAQSAGEYGLVASHHVDDGGIFRVNRRNGDVAICYVLNAEKVVCTPPSSTDRTASILHAAPKAVIGAEQPLPANPANADPAAADPAAPDAAPADTIKQGP